VARSEPTTQVVYLFLKDYIKQHTYPPSLREIAEGCYLSVAGVLRHLDHLEWEGKLRREPARARGITLVDEDEQAKGRPVLVLNRLVSALGRNDELPNQILAKEIAEAGDEAAVQELIDHLTDANKDIQNDCIKVLYEIGARKPELLDNGVAVDAFLRLLSSRNNRLVWGGMTALGTIADRQAAAIWQQIDRVMDTTDQGSAITQDWGIRVVATVSAQDAAYEERIFPFLLAFLKRCLPKDLPRHAESALIAVHAGNQAQMLALLESRKGALKPAQRKRVEQVIRKIKAL